MVDRDNSLSARIPFIHSQAHSHRYIPHVRLKKDQALLKWHLKICYRYSPQTTLPWFVIANEKYFCLLSPLQQLVMKKSHLCSSTEHQTAQRQVTGQTLAQDTSSFSPWQQHTTLLHTLQVGGKAAGCETSLLAFNPKPKDGSELRQKLSSHFLYTYIACEIKALLCMYVHIYIQPSNKTEVGYYQFKFHWSFWPYTPYLFSSAQLQSLGNT